MENNPLNNLRKLAEEAKKAGVVIPVTDGLFGNRKQERQESEVVSLEEAERIFEKDFLGPKAVEAVFGVSFSKESVVPIPFSKEELENAKSLGQQLIFQTDVMKIDEGPFDPEFDTVTSKNLKKVFLVEGDENSMLNNQGWYENEEFFSEKIPRPCWKLTSKDIVPNSTSKNYLEQTEMLVSYIQNEIFRGIELPKEYAEAVLEFEEEKAAIAERMKGGNWGDASQWLADLKITKLTRETPVEAMYRLVLQEKTDQEKLFSAKYAWTSRRASGGGIVGVGQFGSGAAGFISDPPHHSYSDLGVFFSRMK